jgi:hypothetical protein
MFQSMIHWIMKLILTHDRQFSNDTVKPLAEPVYDIVDRSFQRVFCLPLLTVNTRFQS